MERPKVSVLLPTYNGAKFITRAIESVLKQDFRDIELIVVDDGSNDYTPDIVKEFMKKDERIVHSINEKNLGIQKTLNRGLSIAKGEYIARIDDDDEWVERDKLSRQVQFLEEHPDYVIVGTGVIMVDESREELFRFLQPGDDKSIRDRLLFKSCFMHASVLMRKSALLEVGGYSEDEVYRHIEDYHLWLTLGKVGKLANLRSYGIKFMLRKGAISAQNKREQFKKNIALVRGFRGSYPHFFKAITFGYLRLFAYSIYKILPFNFLKHYILKLYKSA